MPLTDSVGLAFQEVGNDVKTLQEAVRQAARGNLIANPTSKDGLGLWRTSTAGVTLGTAITSDADVPYKEVFTANSPGTGGQSVIIYDQHRPDFDGVETVEIDLWVKPSQSAAFQVVMGGDNTGDGTGNTYAQYYISPDNLNAGEWYHFHQTIDVNGINPLASDNSFTIRLYDYTDGSSVDWEFTGVFVKFHYSNVTYASDWGVTGQPQTNYPAQGDSYKVARWLNYARDNNKVAVLDTDVYLESLVTINLNGTSGEQQDLVIQGTGEQHNMIRVANAVGGIHFQGTGVARQHSVYLENLRFAPELEYSGYPFRVTGIEGGVRVSRAVRISNVVCGPKQEGEKKDFTNGVAITGLYRPFMTNFIMMQSVDCDVKWDYCLDVRGTYGVHIGPGCFLNTQRTNGGADYGVRWGGTQAQSPEKFEWLMATANGQDIGVEIEAPSTEPEISIIGGHINSKEHCVVLDGVKFGRTKDVLMFLERSTATASYIKLLNVDGFEFSNDYRTHGLDDLRLIEMTPRVGGAVRNILVSDFGLYGTHSATSAPYYVGPNVENVEFILPSTTRTSDFSSYPTDLVEVDPSASNIIARRGHNIWTWNATVDVNTTSSLSSGFIRRAASIGKTSAGDDSEYIVEEDWIFDSTAGSEDGVRDTYIKVEGVNRVAQRLLRPAVSGNTSMHLLVRDGTGYSLQNVTLGANDSGGTGKRVLVVNNS